MKSEREGFFIEVALGIPLAKLLSYRVPDHLRSSIEVGKRVLVPLGKRTVTGYVVGSDAKPAVLEIRDIVEVLDDQPLFTPHHLAFYRWISDYYFFPLGGVIKAALPASIDSTSRQVISLTEKGRSCTGVGQGSAAAKVMKALAGKKGISLAALQRLTGREMLPGLLTRLERDGLIKKEMQEGRKPVAVKNERWVQLEEQGCTLLTSPELLEAWERKAPRQVALLRFLATEETCALALINKKFGSCAHIIGGLKKKGYISFEQREVYRNPLRGETAVSEGRRTPTPEQHSVLTSIREAIKSAKYAPFLLHGVTGSGKTEVYLTAVEEVLKGGRQALVLIPEISLTPQLVSRFQARFGDAIAILHSRLSAGERYDGWRRIGKGLVRVAIGTRSAIFAPFTRLGIIVVDEEHDASYKQEEKLRYSARDLALVRGRMDHAVVILGSATPSVESYYNTQTGKLTLLQLTRRVEGRPLPRIEIVDMKGEGLQRPGSARELSLRLKEALADRVGQKQQSLLFLNRRGFAPCVICRECGHVFGCPNCSVSLIHHQRVKKLQCHYCGYAIAVPDTCPRCGGIRLTLMGRGTERLEDEIKALLPQSPVQRMDRDTTRGKGGHKSVLNRFISSDGGILIGTQMIAKGHDLPGVTLVGVVSADSSLNFPDFRAGERTFQLLTQVAGRAGRGDIAGEVIIQTFNPRHYTIEASQKHDFSRFYGEEVKFRRELNYPPFSRLINFRMEGTSRKKTADFADRLGSLAHSLLRKEGGCRDGIDLLGPAPAPWEKMKGKYRFQMVAKGSSLKMLRGFAAQLINRLADMARTGGVSFSVDVDPVSLL
jgi:primosomal protein N' (replication factor Y)